MFLGKEIMDELEYINSLDVYCIIADNSKREVTIAFSDDDVAKKMFNEQEFRKFAELIAHQIQEWS